MAMSPLSNCIFLIICILCLVQSLVTCDDTTHTKDVTSDEPAIWNQMKDNLHGHYSKFQNELTKKKTKISHALASIKLPKIFDWKHYKEAFRKVYPTLREELTRKKIFFATTLKIFAHNLGFKSGKSTHYLKVNQFADNTPKEMERVYMKAENFVKATSSDSSKKENQIAVEQKITPFQELIGGLSADELKQELERIIVEKKPGYELLVEQLRNPSIDDRLKETKSIAYGTPEALTTERRIQAEMQKSLSPAELPRESDKYVSVVPSTNSQYRSPFQRHLLAATANNNSGHQPSMEILEPEVNLLDLHTTEAKDKFVVEDHQFTREPLGSVSGGEIYPPATTGYDQQQQQQQQLYNSIRGGLPTDMHILESNNRVYLDWRQSGCLTIPRNQGLCNSCYAFATISLMEWWHCKQTGQLVPFSEQYMVDCGRHVGMSGCDGGNMLGIGKFIMDWGVELRVNYPYTAKDSVCPYKKEEWEHAGYKRPVISRFSTAQNVAIWPLLLKHVGPIIVAVRIPKDFSFYGGMVHRGNDCAVTDTGFVHAMLLVGHGRDQNDEEFWLLRNSHGYEWGEGGYFKLSKNANPNCLYEANEAEFDFVNQARSLPIATSDGTNWSKLSPSEAHLRGLYGKDLSDIRVF